MQQIRSAYVARARRAHPDLVGGKGLDVMRALNEAWAVLKDAGRKATWDLEHRPTGAQVDGAAAAGTGADPNRPFWTGAMGPAPGRPSGSVLRFGIYDGWSIGEIARQDRGYLIWLRDRPEAASFRLEILRLLDPVADEPRPARRFGRR
jgi:curved DNA-binding protein CbpA